MGVRLAVKVMFSIEFAEEPLEYPFDDANIPAAPGKLLLGNTTEEFLANLSLWGKSDYTAHWHRELKSLFEDKPKVALVVSYNDPRAASNMEIWLVYRDGEWARFQNQLPWYSDLPREFDIAKMSSYIEDRQMITAEGDRISEWDVAMRDIELFLWRSNVL